MSTCYMCGASGEMTYGTDGLPYCSACIFYGMNKQCYRCRMYLPAAELQQYKGSLVCPYCIQDMRAEDRRAAEPREKGPITQLSYAAVCERCGRNLDERMYIWNGRRLCKKCLDDEQATWGLVGGGPTAGGQRASVIPIRKAKQKSLLEALASNLLALLGIKKKEPQVIVVGPKMPIGQAKPLAERAMRKEEKNPPEAEGIMMKKKPKKEKGGDQGGKKPNQ